MIEFRPLAETDFPLLREWLGRDHVRLWWRDPIEQDLAECLAGIEGRDPTDYYVILLDGRAVGLVQTYLVSDHPEWEAVVEVGEHVAGIDLLIGEPELTGIGLGPRVLAEFARAVVFADPEMETCVATVEEPNRCSWRAFEKAGFRHVRDVEEDGLPHRLLRLDRGQFALIAIRPVERTS